MLKRKIYYCLLVILAVSSSAAIAKTKECPIKPQYDIVIKDKSVQIINKEADLIISADGEVVFNNNIVPTTAKVKNEAKAFQNYLHNQLPDFELQAYKELDEVYNAFAIAIHDKLGNKSELLTNLQDLHSQLIKLLQKAIITQDDVTYFYYRPFNNLRTDGKAIGKKVFYHVLGDSIIKFDVFKNYSAIKKISKQEWKEQKEKLKVFDEQICQLVTQIDYQYNHLLNTINEKSKDKLVD